jgi:hypothetical protein
MKLSSFLLPTETTIYRTLLEINPTLLQNNPTDMNQNPCDMIKMASKEETFALINATDWNSKKKANVRYLWKEKHDPQSIQRCPAKGDRKAACRKSGTTTPNRMPSTYNLFVKEWMKSRPSDKSVQEWMKEIGKKWRAHNDLKAIGQKAMDAPPKVSVSEQITALGLEIHHLTEKFHTLLTAVKKKMDNDPPRVHVDGDGGDNSFWPSLKFW